MYFTTYHHCSPLIPTISLYVLCVNTNISRNNKKLIVQTQAIIDREFIGLLPSQGFRKDQTIDIEDINDGSESSPINLGKIFQLEIIKKKREIWVKDSTSIIIDYYDSNFILEIQMFPGSISEVDRCIELETRLVKELGINESKIISDSYLFRKIHYKIKSNPNIKINLLEKEIEEMTAKLRKKEMFSGESFKDTGDGWNEKPTYETIYHEILSLNRMIINSKEELNQLKTAAQASPL